MVVLGYSGRRRYASGAGARRRARRTRALGTLFDAVTSFGDAVEDLPLHLLPLDGVGHDAAAALLVDGRVVAAASEERFSRRKHAMTLEGDTLLPREAVAFCLSHLPEARDGILDVAYYCDVSPSVFAQRMDALERALPTSIRSRVLEANRIVYEESVSNARVAEVIEACLEASGVRPKLHFVPHHVAHAASAFYSSGFSDAGILTLDASGEKSSSVFALGSDQGLRVVEETLLPHSLGGMYMLLTAFLGFSPLGGEYKVMGLAPYGDPGPFSSHMEELIGLSDDGEYRTPALARDDFGAHVRELLGPAVARGAGLTRREKDIAAALQRRFEDVVMHRLAVLRDRYGVERLCLAGGCALNCVMAGKVARSGMFDEVYVFPASGDDGCSVGAAQYVYHDTHGARPEALPSTSLGPGYSSSEVQVALERHRDRLAFRRVPSIEREAAALLAAGRIVGWFQGRMEFGPRALGNRSILADPRDAGMRELVNACVKRREGFRPFAPAVPQERAAELFDLDGVRSSPFMQFAVPVLDGARQRVPSVVHHDGSARVQTVRREQSSRFWELLTAFGNATGMPVLLNTSFNVRGEPIVCSPDDALRCFLATQLDVLAIEDFVVTKRG